MRNLKNKAILIGIVVLLAILGKWGSKVEAYYTFGVNKFYTNGIYCMEGDLGYENPGHCRHYKRIGSKSINSAYGNNNSVRKMAYAMYWGTDTHRDRDGGCRGGAGFQIYIYKKAEWFSNGGWSMGARCAGNDGVEKGQGAWYEQTLDAVIDDEPNIWSGLYSNTITAQYMDPIGPFKFGCSGLDGGISLNEEIVVER